MSAGALVLGVVLAGIGLAQLAPPLVSWWQRARFRLPPADRQPAPPVHLVVPCKGGGDHLARHLAAFAAQRYRPLLISFVTESATDAATPLIAALAAQHAHVRHIVAGLTSSGSQKIHNLLAAVAAAPPEVEVFAFCDSDIEPHPDLLRHLVGALVSHGVTVTTGYRWLAPVAGGLAARVHTVLSALHGDAGGLADIARRVGGYLGDPAQRLAAAEGSRLLAAPPLRRPGVAGPCCSAMGRGASSYPGACRPPGMRSPGCRSCSTGSAAKCITRVCTRRPGGAWRWRRYCWREPR